MRALLFLVVLISGCGGDIPVAAPPAAPPAPPSPTRQQLRLTAVTSDTRQGFRFRDRAIVTFDPPPGLAAHDADGGSVERAAAHVDFEFAAGLMLGLRAGHDSLCMTGGRASSLSEVDAGSCTNWSSWAQLGLAGNNAAGTGLLLRTVGDGDFRLLVVESGVDAPNSNFVTMDYEPVAPPPDAGEIFLCSMEGQPCVERDDCCNARHQCVLGACQY